jgi:hypothetical protein
MTDCSLGQKSCMVNFISPWKTDVLYCKWNWRAKMFCPMWSFSDKKVFPTSHLTKHFRTSNLKLLNLQSSDEHIDPDTQNIQFELTSRFITLNVWGNISRNPRYVRKILNQMLRFSPSDRCERVESIKRMCWVLSSSFKHSTWFADSFTSVWRRKSHYKSRQNRSCKPLYSFEIT